MSSRIGEQEAREQAITDPRAGTATSGTYRAQQNTLLDDDLRPSVPTFASTEKNRFLLTMMTGPAKGSVYKLDEEALTLGRAEAADITIPDPSLSRIHAQLKLTGRGSARGFILEDCGSTNGTFVGGERIIQPTFLSDGVRVSFGKRSIARFAVQDALEEQATFSVHDSALKDGLTQVYNRRVFDDRLSSEFAFAARHDRPLSLIFLDIDHFKKFNDTHGHQAGDEVLRHVAGLLTSALRVEDLVARYGGEEFAILARDTLPTEATVVAERLRAIIQYSALNWEGQVLPVTASVGVASNYPKLTCSSMLLSRADEALYRAKREGRNRVVVYGADMQPA